MRIGYKPPLRLTVCSARDCLKSEASPVTRCDAFCRQWQEVKGTDNMHNSASKRCPDAHRF